MNSATILVVDDETIVARDIQTGLRQLGYSVPEVAHTGQEAIDKALDIGPDLVLMDITLRGDMDGTEAADQIQSRLNIPVVYVTAHADDSTLQRAKVAEPSGYIVKPFEERDLHIVIEMALHKHRKDSARSAAERLGAEREIQSTKEQLQKIFNYSNDMILLVDAATDEILEVSPRTCITLGYTREELLSTPLSRLHPEGVDQVRAFARSVLEEGYGWTSDLTCLTRSGITIPTEISATVWEVGGRSCLIIMVRDTNVTRRREQDLEESNERLERQTRELTALNALFTNMLQDRDEAEERHLHATSAIDGFLDRLAALGSDLRSSLHEVPDPSRD